MRRLMAAVVAVGLVLGACASAQYRPVLVAGVEVTALRVIGTDQARAEVAMKLVGLVDALVLGDQATAVDEVLAAVEGAIPMERLMPEEQVLVRLIVSTLAADLYALAPDGVLSDEAKAKVRMYTDAVERAAQAVMSQRSA